MPNVYFCAVFMKGGRIIALLVIVCVGLCMSADAYAQRQSVGKSRKELRAERRARKRGEKYAAEITSPPAKTTPVGAKNEKVTPAGSKRKQDLNYPGSKVKKRYRVGIVVPLYLDELVRGESVTFKDRVPDKAAAGLAFYQGVKLAADSLRRAGAKLDVYIHDAGSFSESPEMLISGRKLDSTDLIIGAVEQHDIPALAGYARKKRINFVSAYTNYDGWVKDNQYFTMLQPSVKSHCEFIIDELSKRHAGQNVTLLYRTSSLADDNAAVYMLNDLYSEVTFHKLLCNTLPTREALAGIVDSTKPNILAVSILDAAFADSILGALAKYYPGIHFEVWGMPTWNDIPTLKKPNAYRNITVHVTSSFNFTRGNSELLASIQEDYKKEFGGMPPEMAMRGYEAMLWYGTLLRRYGTLFNNDYSDLTGAPFTNMRIKPRWDRNGSLLYLENKNIYLSTYQGGIYKTD